MMASWVIYTVFLGLLVGLDEVLAFWQAKLLQPHQSPLVRLYKRLPLFERTQARLQRIFFQVFQFSCE